MKYLPYEHWLIESPKPYELCWLIMYYGLCVEVDDLEKDKKKMPLMTELCLVARGDLQPQSHQLGLF